MENLSTKVDQEIIKLTPEEKDLYQKYLEKNPEMTLTAWDELRQHALKAIDKQARDFYANNYILLTEKPDYDSLKEMSVENKN
jgi:hypothetical protein